MIKNYKSYSYWVTDKDIFEADGIFLRQTFKFEDETLYFSIGNGLLDRAKLYKSIPEDCNILYNVTLPTYVNKFKYPVSEVYYTLQKRTNGLITNWAYDSFVGTLTAYDIVLSNNIDFDVCPLDGMKLVINTIVKEIEFSEITEKGSLTVLYKTLSVDKDRLLNFVSKLHSLVLENMIKY